jgi:ATP-binding protein involved in chromosome partitioning
MRGLSDEQVLAALRRVIDPEKGTDIVSLGMISGVQLRQGHVAFAIEVEAQRGPRLEPLRKAAEKAVEELHGVL